MAQTKINIHDQQYEFWSKLQKAKPTVYRLTPQRSQFCYISKKLTTKPYQLRLDIYLDPSYHQSNGCQSFTICNVPKGGLSDDQIAQIEKEFGTKGTYYNENGRYPNCHVIKNNSDDSLSEKEMMKWFNNHIETLINII